MEPVLPGVGKRELGVPAGDGGSVPHQGQDQRVQGIQLIREWRSEWRVGTNLGERAAECSVGRGWRRDGGQDPPGLSPHWGGAGGGPSSEEEVELDLRQYSVGEQEEEEAS